MLFTGQHVRMCYVLLNAESSESHANMTDVQVHIL